MNEAKASGAEAAEERKKWGRTYEGLTINDAGGAALRMLSVSALQFWTHFDTPEVLKTQAHII